MFDLLKNKFKDFVNKITGAANQPNQTNQTNQPTSTSTSNSTSSHIQTTPQVEQKNQQPAQAAQPKNIFEQPANEPTKQKQQTPSTSNQIKNSLDLKSVSKEIKKEKEKPKEIFSLENKATEQANTAKLEKLQQAALKEKKEFKANVGLIKQISSIFSNKIKIEKKDIDGLLEELEVSFLESDVAYLVAQKLVLDLEKNLVGQEIEKSKLDLEIQSILGKSLREILSSNTLDFDLLLEQKLSNSKPLKILFVGPNGAGKTTTIAKIAKRIQDQGKSVVIAAADTFRAAAIEQLEKHAHNLGIKIIKHAYGSDPAAVAFDAIKYAKAHNIDVVLIDSAGRQETNTNLIDQLKKIVRVNSPDIKIYVGESIAGNAIVDQIINFHQEIKLDAAILTKLDCDPKGGTAISLTYSSSVPIIFFGVGQGYDDLKKFDPDWIINNILPSKAS